MRAETQYECDQMKQEARAEAYSTRVKMKRECENVSEYMKSLYEAVNNVTTSVQAAKDVADQAFPEISE